MTGMRLQIKEIMYCLGRTSAKEKSARLASNSRQKKKLAPAKEGRYVKRGASKPKHWCKKGSRALARIESPKACSAPGRVASPSEVCAILPKSARKNASGEPAGGLTRQSSLE